MTDITHLSDYRADTILQDLEIDPSDRLAQGTIRFLFSVHANMHGRRDLGTRFRRAAEMTREAVEYRYSLYREFAEDFLGNTPVNHDALLIATIAGYQTRRLQSPAFQIGGYDKAYVDQRVREACELYEEAFDLELTQLDNDSAGPEATLLAHVSAMQSLSMIDITPDRDSVQQLEDDMKWLIQPVFRFARQDTKIGQILFEEAEDARQSVLACLPKPVKKPSLSLLMGGKS